LNDLQIMMNNPLATAAGALTGYGHGLSMLGNQLTGGMISPLDNYVNNVINANGGAYYIANMAAGIGAAAGTAALPCGWVANAMKAMNVAISALQAKDDVKNGNWASAGFNLAAVGFGIKGSWCFVEGTPIVVSVEELPAEAGQQAIEVDPGNAAQRLSSLILVGVGVAGFAAVQPVPTMTGRRRSSKSKS
jgi:hypothetical protein